MGRQRQAAQALTPRADRSSKVRLVPLAQLRAAAWNPRFINEASLEALRTSIRTDPDFLWLRPVLARADGTVYAGNQRLRAAQCEGLEAVPAVLEDLPETVAKARALRDNVQAGEWVVDDLNALLEELAREGVTAQAVGLSDDQLDEIVRELQVPKSRPDPDEVPPRASEGRSRVGDLWVLGDHLLLNGDATQAADVQRLFDGRRPRLMVTDPPYGVSYDPTWRTVVATVRQTGAVPNDDRVDWREAFRLFPGDVAYVWHAGVHAAASAAQLEDCDFELRAQIIWVKQSPVLSRGHYHWQHEPAWYACRRGQSAGWRGGRRQSTVWEIPNLNAVGGNRGEEKTGHGTQKPVALMRRPIENHTRRGEYVYDPFVGSGTTIVACELSGRRCLAVELDPDYVDLAVRRWERFTGKEALLHGTT